MLFAGRLAPSCPRYVIAGAMLFLVRGVRSGRREQSYISPVSTLMKWFPDRPGMATGFAIMGFGGGALIASPRSSQLMKWSGADRQGLAATFLAMGADRYRWSFAIMVVLLLIALACNELIRTPQPPISVAAETDARESATVSACGGGLMSEPSNPSNKAWS
jgi:MFS family permease